MTFLDKLDALMVERKLNKHSLAENSKIPYTTIDGWYKKGYDGLKVNTLKKLSSYFGVTLDSWLDTEETDYGTKQKAPAPMERELTLEDQQIINMLPFVPSKVKIGVLHIFAATVDLAAAAESANLHIDEARALAAQADYDDIHQERRG